MEIEKSSIFNSNTALVSKDSSVLDIKNLIILNVHSSVLPGYRGTESEIFALADNKFNVIGNTVHIVDKGIDTGRIISTKKLDRIDLKSGLESVRYTNSTVSAKHLRDVIKEFNNFEGFKNEKEMSKYKSIPTKEIINKAIFNLRSNQKNGS